MGPGHVKVCFSHSHSRVLYMLVQDVPPRWREHRTLPVAVPPRRAPCAPWPCACPVAPVRLVSLRPSALRASGGRSRLRPQRVSAHPRTRTLTAPTSHEFEPRRERRAAVYAVWCMVEPRGSRTVCQCGFCGRNLGGMEAGPTFSGRVRALRVAAARRERRPRRRPGATAAIPDSGDWGGSGTACPKR